MLNNLWGWKVWGVRVGRWGLKVMYVAFDIGSSATHVKSGA